MYALSFLTSEEEAEDVIQEVFVNFWKDNTFQKVKSEVTKIYLFRSVKNNCLNRLKKKDVLRDRLDLLYEDVAEEEMMTWNDELIQEVETEITNMPEQTREIIRVFFPGFKIPRGSRSVGYIYKYREDFVEKWHETFAGTFCWTWRFISYGTFLDDSTIMLCFDPVIEKIKQYYLKNLCF